MKTHLMIHHSLTKDGAAVSWQAIRRYHKSKGWQDVGYHFGVEMVGDRHEVLLGRPFTARAAAAYQQGMNARAVHVCFVGNFDLAPPPDEMLAVAAPHLAAVCDALEIPLNRQHVIGHNEVASYKTCPGRRFDISHLVGMMRGVV